MTYSETMGDGVIIEKWQKCHKIALEHGMDIHLNNGPHSFTLFPRTGRGNNIYCKSVDELLVAVTTASILMKELKRKS